MKCECEYVFRSKKYLNVLFCGMVDVRNAHITITNVHCCYDHGHKQGSSVYPMRTDRNPFCSG
jgi:hypothetical protein